MPESESTTSQVAMPTGTVTFLFADLEGSTRLLNELGDAYVTGLDAYRRIVREAITQHAGRELGTEGDSFFIAFASGSSALRCAVDAQLALRGHEWPRGLQFAARMGIHTGEASPHEDGYVGLAVHHAARVAAAANGGQILVTDATRAVSEGVDGDFELADLGSHRLRDLDASVHLFEVRHERIEPGPRPRTLDARPHNLPVQPTPFTGRETELEEVVKLLKDRVARLVTLLGPGGIGKTRLALQAAAGVADQFADGVWFVPLAAVTSADRVPSAVAQAVGAHETEGATPVEAVLAELSSRELVLVLDNVEHVVDAAPFVAEILGSADRVTIAVTSREVLNLSTERVYPVPPMEVPAAETDPSSVEAVARADAVMLFVERVRARDPSFVLDASNAAAIAEICRHLDGLPLAIELAAARASSLGVQTLLDRLREGLGVLGGGPDDAPERHQTLDAAIAWSYDMLDERHRRIVSALSIFAGSFDADAAGSVCDATLNDLVALADRSLLRRDAESDVPRFSMLETIRAFAANKLRSSDAADEVRRRYLDYFVALASEAENHLHGPHAVVWLNKLTAAHDDLRSVVQELLDRGDHGGAAMLAASLTEFWRMRGHLEEGRQQLERVVDVCAADTAERARAIVGLARIRRGNTVFGTPKELAALLEEAAAAAEAADDKLTLARALAALAPMERSSRFGAAFAAGVEGATIQKDRDKDTPKWRRKLLASGEERGSSRRMLERALVLAEDAGDHVLAAEIRTSPFLQRGRTNFLRALFGDPVLLRGSIESATERGDRAAEAELLLRRHTGDLRERENAARRALDLATDLGDRQLAARAMIRLADVLQRRRDSARAIALLHDALEIARETQIEHLEQDVLMSLFSIANTANDKDALAAMLSRVRQLAGRKLAAVMRTFAVASLSDRWPGVLTTAAGLTWAAAFFIPAIVTRGWVLGAAGYVLTQAADTVAYRPAYRRKVTFNDSIAVLTVGVAFGVGLWVRSELVASLLTFGVLGCLAPAGILRGRVFGRLSKTVNATAMVAGAGVSFTSTRLAAVIALFFVGWIGYRSVRDEPPADVAWAVMRSASAVARFGAAVAAMDVLANWRTAGDFRFQAWGEMVTPVAIGALAVFGLAVAICDSQLRFGGITLALTAAALPNAFVAAPPASQIIGAAFGVAWVFIGVLRWFERRAELPDVYPERFRNVGEAHAPPRALA